jgi:hypothetical protein
MRIEGVTAFLTAKHAMYAKRDGRDNREGLSETGGFPDDEKSQLLSRKVSI